MTKVNINFNILCPYKNSLTKYNSKKGEKIMETAKKKFGARIKEIREKRGLNQEQLAELVNMESRHISRIETGKSFTTLENIEKIAKALKVEINALFSFQHKYNKEKLIDEINGYLKKASESELELAHRVFFAIFR